MNKKKLIQPILQDHFILLFMLLLSAPGIINVILGFNIPIYRKFLWACYITAFPLFLAYILFLINLKWLKYFFYFLALLLFEVNMFLIFNFSCMLSPSILILLQETNYQESSEFLSHYAFTSQSVLSYIITLIEIAVIILCERTKKKIHIQYSFLPSIVLIIWIFVAIVHVGSMTYMLFCKTQYSMEMWYSSIGLYDTENTFSNFLYSIHHLNITQYDNKKAVERNIIALEDTAKCNENDSLDIVVVIGESYNKHHSKLYGYTLNTTPNQCREKEKGHLFPFTDVVSPYNMTTYVIKNIMSVNSLNEKQYWADFPIFPVIFRKVGFQVCIWDNQKIEGNMPFHDFSICSFLYHKKIEEIAYNYSNTSSFQYDEQLIDNFFKTTNMKTSFHNLSIFHLLGQHSYAKWRYPDNKKNNVFTAQDIKRKDLSNSQRQAIAEYDNATLYNDYVVNEIIKYYYNKNALIVYLSDHGEEIYDYRNFLGRSHETNKNKNALRHQYEIPFFIWCSDKYIRLHKDKINRIKSSLHKPYMTDNLPHLLFYLASIYTKYYNEKHNLLSDKYICGVRLIQNNIDYDVNISNKRK